MNHLCREVISTSPFSTNEKRLKKVKYHHLFLWPALLSVINLCECGRMPFYFGIRQIVGENDSTNKSIFSNATKTCAAGSARCGLSWTTLPCTSGWSGTRAPSPGFPSQSHTYLSYILSGSLGADNVSLECLKDSLLSGSFLSKQECDDTVTRGVCSAAWWLVLRIWGKKRFLSRLVSLGWLCLKC